MADTKISALTALTGTTIAGDDVLPIVDTSATTTKSGTVLALIEGGRQLLTNVSTSAQGAGFSSDTYLTGSNVTFPAGYPVVGTTYRCVWDVTKTAAGTAATAITVRMGTNGSTADTSRVAFTMGSGTAAADTGTYEVIVTFRTVGSGTSAVAQGLVRLTSNLTTTGLSNAVKSRVTTSSGFDSTTSGLIIGISYNGGTSAAHTVQLVRAELIL